MAKEENVYEILWYLNEYPDEINATDDIVRNAIKMTRYDFDLAKASLIEKAYIKQREDNKGNEAWEITAYGKLELSFLTKEINAKIQSNVAEMARISLRLSWAVAISTGIAALYYLTEIWTFFHGKTP